MKKISLFAKLMLLTGSMCFLVGILGAATHLSLKDVMGKYEVVAEGVMDDVIRADLAFIHFKQIRIALRSLGLEGLPESEAKAFETEALQEIEKVNKLIAELQSLGQSQELIDKHIKPLEKNWLHFVDVGGKVLALNKKEKTEEVKAQMRAIFLKDCPEAAAEVMKNVEGLRQYLSETQGKWVAEAREAGAVDSNIAMIISIAGILFGFAVGILLSRSIVTEIKKVISELLSGAQQVAGSSTEIASTSSSLSEASSSQAASLQETVATVEELTSMVKLNSGNASEAAKLSLRAKETAQKGQEQITALVNSIQEISSDSKKIEDIINVIDDIAFQTNLLALNAAVEAARAGEQGRGFAVVAEAVRNLAQRSSVAAREINDLIKKSVEKIEKGVSQAEQSGSVLNEIVVSVQKVSDLNESIAVASDEQANGIVQIGQVMNNLDGITQQNASAAEQSAAASEQLSAQAQILKTNLSVLTEVVEGHQAAKSA